MPKSKGKRSPKRAAGGGGTIPRPLPYAAKPIRKYTFGWTATPAATFTIAVTTRDLCAAIASPQASVASAAATMWPLFTCVRIRKIEVWDLQGNSVVVTPYPQSAIAPFVTGPDETIVASGTTVVPTRVVWVPKPRSLGGDWFNDTSPINILAITVDKLAVAPEVLIRAHLDTVVSDALDGSASFATAAANTLTGGRNYWRILNTGGTNFQPEGSSALATYFV